MSLVSKKIKQLLRDTDNDFARDMRHYIIATEDRYAPDQYFEKFRELLRNARILPVVMETTDTKSAAEYVVERIIDHPAQEEDQKWVILDTDHYVTGNHQQSFQRALAKARQNKINVALNKPCFEFWLLLHYLEDTDPVLDSLTDGASAEDLLRKILGSYNKNNVDAHQFTLDGVVKATLGGRKRDLPTNGTHNPNINTSRVYMIWEQIVKNSTLNQLPEPLRELKEQLTLR